MCGLTANEPAGGGSATVFEVFSIVSRGIISGTAAAGYWRYVRPT